MSDEREAQLIASREQAAQFEANIAKEEEVIAAHPPEPMKPSVEVQRLSDFDVRISSTLLSYRGARDKYGRPLLEHVREQSGITDLGQEKLNEIWNSIVLRAP